MDIRVLAIGTDENIFNPESDLRKRVASYAEGFSSFHVLCRTSNKNLRKDRYGNVRINPAYSRIPLLSFWSAYKEGKEILKQEGTWIISTENPFEEGLSGWLLKKRFGSRLQLNVHTDVFSPYYRRAGWKERVRYLLAKFLIPKADCVRVVSERIKKSILKSRVMNRESGIAVLPIFTDISKFTDPWPSSSVAHPDTRLFVPRPAVAGRDPGPLGLGASTFKMIAVGRFVDKEKNFSMLIEMMNDFVKVCPTAVLVLVGDGPDKESLEFKVKSLKLEKNVIIESWRRDLSSFYKSFDIYLMSSNYEGWGRTVIEAMASGLPVIMTDVGLAGEVVKNGENGIVVSIGDKKAMLEAVTDLHKNPEKRKRLSARVIETVKNLKPGTKEEYVKLYKESFELCGITQIHE